MRSSQPVRAATSRTSSRSSTPPPPSTARHPCRTRSEPPPCFAVRTATGRSSTATPTRSHLRTQPSSYSGWPRPTRSRQRTIQSSPPTGSSPSSDCTAPTGPTIRRSTPSCNVSARARAGSASSGRQTTSLRSSRHGASSITQRPAALNSTTTDSPYSTNPACNSSSHAGGQPRRYVASPDALSRGLAPILLARSLRGPSAFASRVSRRRCYPLFERCAQCNRRVLPGSAPGRI